MIAIVDYGAGNLGSIEKALRYIGAEAILTHDPAEAAAADGLVLPGVGAFGHCMSGLESADMRGAVLDFVGSGRPFLGICVGLQMLFTESVEMGSRQGLGVIPGRVIRFGDTVGADLKIPQIGWNSVRYRPGAALFAGIPQETRFYFVHSYYPAPESETVVSATADYGGDFCCAVEVGNVHATQFHPEKSGSAGLAVLRNFAALCA
jgi:glutamine amidotransferase